MKLLKVRSYERELLDNDNIPEKDLNQNLKEIAFVNKYLGGNQITTSGLKKLLKDKSKIYHIIDIGCGAGDNLKAISHWGTTNGFQLKLYGLDIKKEAIDYARKNTNGIDITFIIDSYENLNTLPYEFDVATCCLFCHHFHETQLSSLFITLQQNCKVGFIINDLHRHWLAYYFIKWAGMLFSQSYLFKNDAPLSVARGFKKKDFDKLMQSHKPFSIEWKWAFRWLVIQS